MEHKVPQDDICTNRLKLTTLLISSNNLCYQKDNISISKYFNMLKLFSDYPEFMFYLKDPSKRTRKNEGFSDGS